MIYQNNNKASYKKNKKNWVESKIYNKDKHSTVYYKKIIDNKQKPFFKSNGAKSHISNNNYIKKTDSVKYLNFTKNNKTFKKSNNIISNLKQNTTLIKQNVYNGHKVKKPRIVDRFKKARLAITSLRATNWALFRVAYTYLWDNMILWFLIFNKRLEQQLKEVRIINWIDCFISNSEDLQKEQKINLYKLMSLKLLSLTYAVFKANSFISVVEIQEIACAKWIINKNKRWFKKRTFKNKIVTTFFFRKFLQNKRNWFKRNKQSYKPLPRGFWSKVRRWRRFKFISFYKSWIYKRQPFNFSWMKSSNNARKRIVRNWKRQALLSGQVIGQSQRIHNYVWRLALPSYIKF